MRIGRLQFGIATGQSDWSYLYGSCGCHLLGLGRFYATWLAKDCKCTNCCQYECICEPKEESPSPDDTNDSYPPAENCSKCNMPKEGKGVTYATDTTPEKKYRFCGWCYKGW